MTNENNRLPGRMNVSVKITGTEADRRIIWTAFTSEPDLLYRKCLLIGVVVHGPRDFVTANAMIDTGAQRSIIAANIADKLRLESTGQIVRPVTCHSGILECEEFNCRLQVGPSPFDIALPVVACPALDSHLAEILIGMDFLQRFKFSFWPRQKKWGLEAI